MEGIRSDSKAARGLAQRFQTPLTLVDVGCSGGIDGVWRCLSPHLRAIGFDLVSAEVARLNAEEADPAFRYFCANIGLPADHPLSQLRAQAGTSRRNPWANLAVYAALEADGGRQVPVPAPEANVADHRAWEQGLVAQAERALETWRDDALVPAAALDMGTAGTREDAEAMARNLWHLVAAGDNRQPLTLPQALGAAGVDQVDFLKLDVDGGEYEILFTLKDRLDALGVLGVGVEVNFFGSDLPHQNTFHAVDRLLKGAGFTLFDLSKRRYSASSLPSRFTIGYAAQSEHGRILQGDALYLRDPALGVPGFLGSDMSADRALKLTALFALFDLPDQAADALMRGADRLIAAGVDVQAALDSLTAEMREGTAAPATHAEHLAGFAARNPWFYGGDMAIPTPSPTETHAEPSLAAPTSPVGGTPPGSVSLRGRLLKLFDPRR